MKWILPFQVLVLLITSETAFIARAWATLPDCDGRYGPLGDAKTAYESRRKPVFRAKEHFAEQAQAQIQPFELMDWEQLEQVVQRELREAIKTGYGQLSSKDLTDFQRSIQNFKDQGGIIHVDWQNAPDSSSIPYFKVAEDGGLHMSIPFQYLIGCAAGVSGYKGKLMGQLVHELQHFVSTMRISQSLQRSSQMTEIEARTFGARLREDQPEAFARHVLQMEEEAVRAEGKLLNQAPLQNVWVMTYPQADALQVLFYGYRKAGRNMTADQFALDPAAISISDSLVSESIRFLEQFGDGRKLPDSVILAIKKVVHARLRLRDRQIRSIIQKLASLHPELGA